LAKIYSAADVMVVPSIQEVFGQTATEALACGTPVVAFGATGLLDIVEHQSNGYLAQPFSPDDLWQGIDWVLSDKDRRKRLSNNARKTAIEKFCQKVVVKNYIDLYNHIIF